MKKIVKDFEMDQKKDYYVCRSLVHVSGFFHS
jgi:hypothetical protein